MSHETIVATLQADYGLAVRAVTFLPVGNDSASAVYRIETGDGQVYFLKVRIGAGFGEPSLAVPHTLHGRGVPHILAPLSTTTGRLWVGLDGFALSLYPFVDGRTAVEAGLSEEQWRLFGAAMKQIHTCPLTPELAQILPCEAFIPSRRALLPSLEAAVNQEAFGNEAERELAAFWRARQNEISMLVERADTLANQLRRAALPQVLCHADLHTWNVLVDANRHFWLVDWDETILAPKERDLMFVIGGIGSDLVSRDETACFLQGYGDTAINSQALLYYRYAWAVQDIAACGEWVFFLPDFGLETRLDAARGFISLFEPGSIVDIAFAEEGVNRVFSEKPGL